MKTEALDFFGNKIQVGDEIAFMQIGYRNLMKGVVRSITEKTVLIGHEKTNVGSSESRQLHGQVICKIKPAS